MGSQRAWQQQDAPHGDSTGDDRRRPAQDAGHDDRIDGIVHDLRSPLSALLSELDWLARRLPIESEASQALEAAQKSAQRLNRMISHLLSAGRVEAVEVPVLREPLCALGFLSEIVLSYSRRCADSEMLLAPPTGVEFIVRADPMLLRRVLENLLDNALRHTPSGGRIAVEASSGAAIVISVANDGRGIPVGSRERIFEKFPRGEGEPSRVGNFGLGLYICRRAIEAHGGPIGVVQREGWATSFEIVLPC
jgi:signal transduction histidine kinase